MKNAVPEGRGGKNPEEGKGIWKIIDMLVGGICVIRRFSGGGRRTKLTYC